MITRTQARAGGTPNPGQGKGPDPELFSALDNTMFEGGTKGPRKSCCQQQFVKGLKSRELDCTKGLANGMWEVPGDIGAVQREDGTLKPLFAKVVGGLDMAKGEKEYYVVDSDVWYAVADDDNSPGTHLAFAHILQILLAFHVC